MTQIRRFPRNRTAGRAAAAATVPPRQGGRELAAARDGIFICWSRPRGGQLAELCRELLGSTIPALEDQIFTSPQIEKGARWFEEVLRQLETARVGIICLTPESLDSPWLHFEAGALLRGMHVATGAESGTPVQNRAFTFLFDVEPAALAGPLSQYQSTTANRADTRSMLLSIAAGMGTPWGPEQEKRFRAAWRRFEHGIDRLDIPLQQLVPDFEEWFRRKTFEEPLNQCSDQAWTARYDGARQTQDRITSRLAVVRATCPRYQVDLCEHLLVLVDSYAMDIRALLLRARPFALRPDGLLDIPPSIQSACENRRARIKEVVSRILDPMNVPVSPAAACYWLSDSFDQRKMLIHRCQHEITAAMERVEGAAPLPDIKVVRAMTRGHWELDRIHAYLLIELAYRNARDVGNDLVRAAAEEVERLLADRGRSAMPLYYALRALLATQSAGGGRKPIGFDALRADIEPLLAPSRRTRGPARPAIDQGGQIRGVLKNLDRLRRRSRRSRT